jgi:hypothetical protein
LFGRPKLLDYRLSAWGEGNRRVAATPAWSDGPQARTRAVGRLVANQADVGDAEPTAKQDQIDPMAQQGCRVEQVLGLVGGGRWLLMTHDRMQSDEFLLTQEFLAMMLGVQRTGVTAAAGALQRAGLIRYKRGNVTIIDRPGLRRRSCECYGVSKMEFDRLLGDRAMPKARSGRMH